MLSVLVSVKCNFMKFESIKSGQDKQRKGGGIENSQENKEMELNAKLIEAGLGPAEIMEIKTEVRDQGVFDGRYQALTSLMKGSASVLFQFLGNPEDLEGSLGKGAASAVTLLRQALESQGCVVYAVPGEVIGPRDATDIEYAPVRSYGDWTTVKQWKVLSSGVLDPSGAVLLPAKIDEA